MIIIITEGFNFLSNIIKLIKFPFKNATSKLKKKSNLRKLSKILKGPINVP